MIIKRANIYTMDERKIASSMIIERRRIREIGAGTFKEGIDLKDRYILPGFIDSHVHFLGVGLRRIFPDMQGVESLEDVFERLLRGYRKAKEFGFLIGYDFEEGRIREKRFPARGDLDKIARDIPIILLRIDGHSASLNSNSFDRIFDKYYPGIELDRYKEPTGLVRAEANERVRRYINRRLSKELKIEAYFKASEEALSKGITTLAALVGSEDPEDDSCEVLMEIKERLRLDVIPFYQTQDIDRIKSLGLKRIGGCILIDGSLGSHTAALKEDYTDDPGNKGVLYFSDDELFRFLKSAHDASLQTAVHAIGDRAVEQVVRTYEKFLKDNSLRHRIEHAELLDNELIRRIKRLGLILSIQPSFEGLWGKGMYRDRLGDRAKFMNPFKRLLEAGILLIGGSDAPITSLDPFLGVASAVSHPNPSLSLSKEEAVELFTTMAAYGMFKENEAGRLKRGFWADFLIFSSDPFNPSKEERKPKILEVYKKGERVFP